MSRRPILKPYKVIDNVSMAGNIISAVTVVSQLTMISYDITWAGTTPVGVMSVELSNSYSLNVDGSVRNAGDWTTLTLSSTPSVSGNTGHGFIDIDATGAYAMRLVYTRTSGTGVMNAVINAKVA